MVRPDDPVLVGPILWGRRRPAYRLGGQQGQRGNRFPRRHGQSRCGDAEYTQMPLPISGASLFEPF